jgi:hypothetical protein
VRQVVQRVEQQPGTKTIRFTDQVSVNAPPDGGASASIGPYRDNTGGRIPPP